MNYKTTYNGFPIQFWESSFLGEYLVQMNPVNNDRHVGFEVVAIWKIKVKK